MSNLSVWHGKIYISCLTERSWLCLCWVTVGEMERKLEDKGSSMYLSHLSLTSSSAFRVIWSSRPVSSRPGTPCCLCVFVNDEHTLMFIHAHKYVLNFCLGENSQWYNTVYSSVFLQLPQNQMSAQNQPSGCISAKGNPFWSKCLKLRLVLIKMAIETEGAFRPNF